MVNSGRTDLGNNGQQRPNAPPEHLTEAEMLRHLYGWTLTTEERLRRLEEGRASEGPSGENKDHTQEVNAESEKGSSAHSKESIPHPLYSEPDESADQKGAPNMFTVWKHLDRFHPEKFSGGLPTNAESWIDRLEMLFESIGCDKYQKVIAAKTLLAGGALDWWNTVKPADGHQLEWDEFKRMFFDYYFPMEMRHQKEAEFFVLRQGEMDENTFIAKFMGLAKYVSQLDRTNKAHNNWLARQMFEKCNDTVKARMGTYDITTLEELIAKIREVCRRYRDAERSMKRDSQGRFNSHMGISGGVNKKNYHSSSSGSGSRRSFHQGSFQQRNHHPMS